MRAGIVIASLLGLALIPASAMADDRPGPPWDFEFTYTGPADITDESVRWYTLELTQPPPSPDYTITYLELEIVGLSHEFPQDLNIFLLDPLGEGIEVQDDAGDGFSVSDITVQYTDFTDKPVGLPHGAGEGAIQDSVVTGRIYLPDGPEAFTDYEGTEVGTSPWIFVMVDDAMGDSGSFESVSLHGTAVPEPMTLSLLAIGALATLRRKRR
jgi:hypothetical protein